MALRFYNTLTQQTEDFQPLDGNTVRMYTCGPTVYNYVHIGNLRTFTFQDILRRTLKARGYTLDTDLNADDWVQLVGAYKDAVARETGEDFPQDPHAQLWGAIGAVFSSWMNARAVTYRRLHDILRE